MNFTRVELNLQQKRKVCILHDQKYVQKESLRQIGVAIFVCSWQGGWYIWLKEFHKQWIIMNALINLSLCIHFRLLIKFQCDP